MSRGSVEWRGAARRMKAKGVRRTSVVNEQGGLGGGFDDIVDFLAEELAILAGPLNRQQQRQRALMADTSPEPRWP